MPEQESSRVSKDDIERVSSKLEAIMDELPEQERNVLGLILTRAATATESEVEGFAFSPAVGGSEFSRPFAGQLAQSAGLRGITGSSSISWHYKF